MVWLCLEYSAIVWLYAWSVKSVVVGCWKPEMWLNVFCVWNMYSRLLSMATTYSIVWTDYYNYVIANEVYNLRLYFLNWARIQYGPRL